MYSLNSVEFALCRVTWVESALSMALPGSSPDSTACNHRHLGQCSAVMCSQVQCSAVMCTGEYSFKYSAVQCTEVQSSAVICSTMQCYSDYSFPVYLELDYYSCNEPQRWDHFLVWWGRLWMQNNITLLPRKSLTVFQRSQASCEINSIIFCQNLVPSAGI